ncbi:Holliday junction resolvase RuvX [Candidatus Saccharibacteria bacterium]|nr:Holliday junction resolvase RuvX [Candidatus Saccharibacteria bacterium]
MALTAISLDIGTKRIGVAVASLITRFPRPLTTLTNDEDIVASIRQVIETEDAGIVVAGLPRGLDGQETAQTSYAREFVAKLQADISLPFFFQDEALTSVRAEQELKARGGSYERSAIDALAAVYILEDYLEEAARTL